jgi:N4-gp56 family major capsid protein
MTTTTWPTQTNAMSKGNVEAASNTFVPAMWADEMLVTRESNLVAARLFKRINHKGKAGDTITLPFISDLSANNKTATQAVTIQYNSEGKIAISLDKHKEVSFIIEDFLKVQSKYDLRSEYVKKAAYAITKQIDTDILDLFHASLAAGYKVIGSDGTTAYATGNEADLTDEGLRAANKLLDDNDVPDDRFLIIPPSQKKALLGIDKFVLYQNIGRTKEIQTGMFGEIYGIKIYVSTNCDTVGTARVCVLAHQDAVCCAMQQDIRAQAQYKQENLGTLFTADCIYGVKGLRLDATDVSASNYRKSHAVAIYTP